MASENKRERLVTRVAETVAALPWVRTVRRELPGEPAELQAYAATQLPLVAVAAQLPSPRESKPLPGGGKAFRSVLEIRVNVYGLAARTPDTLVSDWLDDLWRELTRDPSMGGEALDVTIGPETAKEPYPPYLAFGLTLMITYTHARGV